MTAPDYISKQDIDRQTILTAIHAIILEEDKSVTADIGLMMRSEMILYNEKGCFKYGLAGVKNHMSLHMMPIYMDALLHTKYQKLLPSVQFQKGCINFKHAADMPLEIIRQLVADCSKVSMVEMMERRKKPGKKLI